MYLHNLKFWERSKLKLISKIFSIEKPEAIFFDELEIGFKKAKISQANIPPISSPRLTIDFCLSPSKITNLNVTLQEPQIKNLTEWLSESFLYPKIEFLPLLNLPPRAGKSYRQVQTRQLPLFEKEDEKCIHGLRKSWCSICVEKERQKRKRTSSYVDPFDLIFPILQPPLSETFDSPIDFREDLKPFQRAGIKFLTEHKQALLGDEMGLGKTIQAITAARALFRTGKITSGLILCPKSILSNWEVELEKWAPELRVIKVRGPKEQRQILWNTPTHLYLTNYETLREDLASSLQLDVTINPDGSHVITCPHKTCPQRLHIEQRLFGVSLICPTCKHEFVYTPVEDIAKKQFDLIILDEIQKIKNPTADITKAVRQINAHIRWGLSGTPLENRIEDLISIFGYLKPDLLYHIDAETPEVVKNKIKPYFLRRRKKEAIPELPEKVREEIWLELTPSQREAYKKAAQEGIVALKKQGDLVTVHHILALITKLKQICNLDSETEESCKLEYLLEQLENISEQGDKALVFSQYPEKTLKFLEEKLKNFNPLIYHGSLSDSQREKIIEKFQEKDENKVLLISVKAGGLGLTLTKAHYVFHFDLWWNPAVAEQAEDRAHRIGQEKTVFVTYLFTKNTIEQEIQNLLERKRKLFKEVIDDLSDIRLSKILTEEELFGLFGLEKPKRTKAIAFSSKKEISYDSLTQISPQKFEDTIAELYSRMGYQVKQTPPTKDKGIDIYAKRFSESGVEFLAIQCKHYPNGVVGVEHARALYGVIQDHPEITKGILITTGRFSKGCKEFARGKRLELFDGKYTYGLLQKYNIIH